jgi:hypothetical protein
MSRSNPTDNAVNPASKFIEWSGSEGKFKYYDKEKKENVFIELPFYFLPLDQLSTTKGYDEKAGLGFYSNEIRNTKTDMLTVRTKNGVVMTGLYETVKEKLSSRGLDYVQSVYVAIKEGKSYVLANLQLKGSALGPYIEFCKGKKMSEIGVAVKKANPMKKGATKYFEPVYEILKVSEEANNVAVELDRELQEYLTPYLAKNASTVAAGEVVDANQDNGLNSKSKSTPKSEVKIEEKEADIVFNPADDDDESVF